MGRESYWLYLTPALLSLLVHVIFSVPLVFNLQSAVKLTPQQEVSALEAVSIKATAVEQEVQRLRDIDVQKEQALIDKVAAAQKAQKAAELAAEQASASRKVEEQKKQKIVAERKVEEQKKQQAAAERKVEEKKKQKAEAERKAEDQKRLKAEAARKIEEEKKQKAEAARKAEEQKKQKAEAARKAEEEKKQKAEAARKAEEEKKQKAEAARKVEEKKKADAEAARKVEEEKKQKAEQQARDQRLNAALGDEIKNRTSANFNLTGLPEGLSCKLEISLSPSGEVLGVIVTGSSGNELFDRRAELAVKKASPLPVPSDPRDFVRLKLGKISFTFKP